MHLTRHLPRSVPAFLRALFASCLLANHLAAAESPEPATGGAIVELFDSARAPLKDDVRAVAVAGNGSMIVGSNQLAAFDGERWQKIAGPNTYGFRALAPAPAAADRVWVGAIDHIGFVERDASHDWTFVPVSTASLPLQPPLGDIWSVHPLTAPPSAGAAPPRHGAVWIASQQVLRWDGQRLDSWALPSNPRLSGFNAGPDAFIYQVGRGLLRLGLDGEPTLVVPEAELPAKPVTWMLPPPGPENQESTMLVGLGDRAFRWDGARRWTRHDSLSAALANTTATTAAVVDETHVAIGTFDAGIVIASRDGSPLAHLTRRHGLADDSVYALAAAGGRLFAGLPGGLVRIDGAADARWFGRETHLDRGTPRKVLAHAGATFLLASNGLHRVAGADPTPALQRTAAPAAPLWDAASVGDRLWFGGFGGIWRASEREAAREFHAAADVLHLMASPRVAGGIVFTEGYELKSLTPSPHGGWAARSLRVSLPDTPVSLLEDAAGEVWASTVKQGIARFRWRDAPAGAPAALETHTLYRPGAALPAGTTRPVLALIGGQLHAFAEEQPLRLEDDGRFRVVPGFERFAVIGAVEIAAASDAAPATSLWLVQVRDLAAFGTYAVVRVRGDSAGPLEPLAIPGLDRLGALARIDRVAPAAEASVWITGARGVLRLPEATLHRAPPPPRAHLVPLGPATRAIAPAASTAELRVDAAGSGLAFRFPAAGAVSGESVFYQTRLEGVEPAWSAPRREAHREFSRLAPGAYVFEARALDRFGRPGEPARQAFVVVAPWWRRPFAYAVYGVALALAIAGAARWRIRRLQRQNERLNQLVAERTRELELSNTAKSEFLENISHEIRNPLNGLTGLLNLMKEEKMAPQERDLAKSLKGVAGTLTRVFEDVLEFSKLEYGYAKLHSAPFALRQSLQDVIAVFALAAQQQNCPLSLEWPADLADGFMGDEERVKTIVSNFVGNALKYAPGAPVEIRVSATDEATGLVDLYIEVTDHGPGIPPEEQGLIFKKFVRGSDAKRREISGTGLGLATCHVLARLMNGNVGIESTPGRGAMFFLRLLLARAEPPRASAAPASRAPAAAERALIVDDEAYNRTVLEGLALELGLQPRTAADGHEAMRLVHEFDYAVVFLDWELPGLKGCDLAKFIRARVGGDLPVILATTAHDSDEMRKRCREAGMDGYLRKPFNADQVRRALAAAREARVTRDATVSTAVNHRACSEFWREPHRAGAHPGDLDLGAFDHYARARPDDPSAARRNYLQALDTESAELTRALAARENPAIARVAHRLRALAGLIGAAELNVNARRLEEFARADDTARLGPQAHAVLDACALLRDRLEVDHPAPAPP